MLDRGLAARWKATFDINGGYGSGEPPRARMEQGIHFAMSTPEVPTILIGQDGHPRRDIEHKSFLPPIPLPRRMWASSKIEFHAPLRIGAKTERISRIVSITEKEGGSGKLAFVDVLHETRTRWRLRVRETQTLVYRAAAASDAPLSPPEPGEGRFDPDAWEWVKTYRPDERLLFRFSALTFNTHRIHYDLPYAREVERYRGLVVHGPLIASLLLKTLSGWFPTNRVKRFEFRGVSPAIAGEEVHFALREAPEGIELGAFASDGRQITKASAKL